MTTAPVPATAAHAHAALAPLKAAFPDVKFFVATFRDMTTVVVPREVIAAVCKFLRDDPAARFEQLVDLHGVDYLGFPGASHRFALHYGLLSHTHNTRLWLKVFFDPTRDTTPAPTFENAQRDETLLEKADPGLLVESVIGVWPAADWMEREAYDMFGFVFTGHPDLRRILTWNGYGNHPLRKDYPLRGVGERERYKIAARDGA